MGGHPRALALVGMPGAGKTLCAQHLEERGFYQFRFGGIVTDEVVRRGQPLTPDNERTVREELRRYEGMDAIAKRALPELQSALKTYNTLVIDGLYSFSEYKTLIHQLDLVMVAIACARHLRYERLKTRPVRPLTPEEAQQRDIVEIETIEKGGPIAIADYTLLNEGESSGLLAALDTLLEKLGFRP